MNIWIITHYYPPEPGAPQARLSEMAKVWSENGHKVTVLTGFPNHPTGILPEEYRGKAFMKEDSAGISIWRHWVYATPNKGFLKKTLCHVSLMFTLIFFSLFRGEKPDVIVVSSPTFFSVISAFFYSLIRRIPYIFEVRDLWPGIFVELKVLTHKGLIRCLETIELFLYRKAKCVVAVTKGFKKDICDRGIPEEKVFVITNGADLERFKPGEKQNRLLAGWNINSSSFLVLYAGAHGISQGLGAVLEAAAVLKEKRPQIHFLFVGEGAEKEKLLKQKESGQLSNVSFVSSISKELMNELYQTADVCLVPLKNISGFQTFIPSKMFEMMAAGRPIIGMLEGEAAEIVKESEGGTIIPPEDSGALVEILLQWIDNPLIPRELGNKAFGFVSEHYDRKKLAIRYLDLIRQVIKKES